MPSPCRFLFRMLGFLVACVAVVTVLHAPLVRAFMANPSLNSLIVAVLVFGILYTFRQVLMIGREASWVEDWKKTQQGAATGNAGEPSNLLAPLAKMLESRGPRGSLSEIGSASCREGVCQRV